MEWMCRFHRAGALVLGLVLLCFSTGASILTKDKQYVEYFLRMHSAELFRDQAFVLDKSGCYVSPKRLEMVEMSLSCYKVLTLNQARKMIVDLSLDLLDKINADSGMKERGLVTSRFTVDRIKLKVKTNNVFSKNADVTSIRMMELDHGVLTYETYTPSTLYTGFSKTYKETFQYALMLLDNPALLEEVDAEIRDKGKKTAWKGTRYLPESPSFSSLPVQKWPVMLVQMPFLPIKALFKNQSLELEKRPFAETERPQLLSLESQFPPYFFELTQPPTSISFAQRELPQGESKAQTIIFLPEESYQMRGFRSPPYHTVLYEPVAKERGVEVLLPMRYESETFGQSNNLSLPSASKVEKDHFSSTPTFSSSFQTSASISMLLYATENPGRKHTDSIERLLVYDEASSFFKPASHSLYVFDTVTAFNSSVNSIAPSLEMTQHIDRFRRCTRSLTNHIARDVLFQPLDTTSHGEELISVDQIK